MSQQTKTRFIDRISYKVLSRTPEEHNLKGSTNQRLKIKIGFNGKSFSFDFHDSVSNYNDGTETSKEDILNSVCDDSQWNSSKYKVSEICDELGCEPATAEKIQQHADKIMSVFTEDEIRDLKQSANGEDFETDSSDEAKKQFSDEGPLFNSDKLEEFKKIGLDFSNKDEWQKDDIALIPKRIKEEDKFLLGETQEGERVYLVRGSWDCGWYYGFGYLATFDKSGEWSSHSHADQFFKKFGIDGILEFFKGGKMTITKKQCWIFADLLKTFYTLKDSYELYHRGNSNFTSHEGLNLKDEKTTAKIKADIRKVIIETQKMISPKDGEPEKLKGE